VLDLTEFEFFIKNLDANLFFVSSLSFTAFWAWVTQCPEIINFLDEFLERFQKTKDLNKLFKKEEAFVEDGLVETIRRHLV